MREIISIVLLFLLVQLIGLYVGMSLIQEQQEFAAVNVAFTRQSGDVLNSFLFLAAVLGGAVFILLLLRMYKGVLLLKLMEFFIIFVSSNIVFYAILLTLKIPFALALSLFMALLFAGVKFFSHKAKNAAAVVSSAGVGAVFGFSLDIVPAIIFTLGLSVYDVLAVFWTKHMVVMARELGKRNLSFSVSATRTVKVQEHKKKKPVERKSVLELGTGDMSIPLMLAVSTFKFGASTSLWVGLSQALFVIAGSTIALALVLYFVVEKRMFLPALPPITFGSLAGLVVARLLGF